MPSHRFGIERLSDSHDRAAFSCGNAHPDRYLREQAGQDQRRRVNSVFVLVDESPNKLAGFYTLSATQVEPSSLPRDVAKRLPRRPVPATLIGRLAIDLEYRGRQLGRRLLADALIRAARASRDIAALAVIVDAKDDPARAFYEHHGFRRFGDDPYRLFIPMADAERHSEDS